MEAVTNLTKRPTERAYTFDASGYPSCLRLSNIPIPTAPPTPTSIIVRTCAAALNPVDIQIMNLPIWSLPIPSDVRRGVMGAAGDFSGIVIAAGAETKFQPDDQVFGLGMAPFGGSGTLRDVAVIETKTAAVAKKPREWGWAQAAAVPLVWLTARKAIESVASTVDKGIRGKKLVVLGGSSSTGMYMVHLAKQRGWSVLSTCSGKNTDFVRSMGADAIVDYTARLVPEEVRAFAPDAIIDCVGGTDCLHLAARYVTIVGDKTSRSSMGGNLIYFWNPQMVLRWALGRLGLGVHYDCVNLDFNSKWLGDVGAELPQEKIAIDSQYPFEQTKEAYERLNTGRARGKVVVNIAE